MHLVKMETAEGRVAQRSNTTPGQVEIFRALDIPEPGRFLDFEVPTPDTQSLGSNSRSNTTSWRLHTRSS
jgi:hypothetical protein